MESIQEITLNEIVKEAYIKGNYKVLRKTLGFWAYLSKKFFLLLFTIMRATDQYVALNTLGFSSVIEITSGKKFAAEFYSIKDNIEAKKNTALYPLYRIVMHAAMKQGPCYEKDPNRVHKVLSGRYRKTYSKVGIERFNRFQPSSKFIQEPKPVGATIGRYKKKVDE